MLTKITLSPKYREQSPLIQLWLQSRVVPGGGEKDAFLSPCRVRPYTWTNVKIAMDMGVRLVPRCVAAALSPEHSQARPLIATYVGALLLQAVLPALQLSASGKLLDLAERTLSSGNPVSWVTAIWAAAVIVFLALLAQEAKLRFRKAETRLCRYIRYKTEKEYFRIQLSEPLPSSEDPLHVALLTEAGVHGGSNYARGPTGYEMRYTFMNDKIRELGCLLSDLVAIVSQLWVTVYALRSGSSGKDTASFVLLFTFPVLVEIWGENRPDYAVVSFKSRGDDEMIIRKMKDTASDREEAVVMGMQDYILRRWEEATLKYNEGREDDEEVGYDRGGRSLTVTTALQNFVWVLLATKAITTSNSLATLTLLQGAITGLSSRILFAARSVRYIMGQTIFLAAFVGMIDEQDKLRRRGAVDYETVRHPDGGVRIVARDLSVIHGKQGKPAVANVNLTVEPGETLAIVGFNGSGKTTLVKTLLGLVRASSGDISLNGTAISALDMSTVYPRISVIFQDFHKYGLTLKEEIAAGDISSLNSAPILQAAIERGRTQPVVDRVKLDTIISPYTKEMAEKLMHQSGNGESEEDDDPDAKPWYERATFISGGEWQRVALARAFMAVEKADLIVFDEPTAALDPKAESELFETLLSLSKAGQHRCTTIFISHQFGNVRRADKIAFMDNGEIAEYGTHDELMALGGKYSELFAIQGKGFQN